MWLIRICEIVLTHLLISPTGCLFHSLELELPGELILSLLQLLSAPHVLVVHVLDLGFDALELGIQLRGEKQRERERGGWREPSPSAAYSLMNWSTPWQQHWRHWRLETRAANRHTATWKRSLSAAHFSSSFILRPFELLRCSLANCADFKQVG